jgi:hypothetical protein
LISNGKLGVTASDSDTSFDDVLSTLAAVRIEPCRLVINELMAEGR